MIRRWRTPDRSSDATNAKMKALCDQETIPTTSVTSRRPTAETTLHGFKQLGGWDFYCSTRLLTGDFVLHLHSFVVLLVAELRRSIGKSKNQYQSSS